jgi:hypothetical protein
MFGSFRIQEWNGVENRMNELKFDVEEHAANSHLMAYMNYLRRWGLNCNEQEMTAAIHALQLFVIKRMLQRLGAEDFSDWYDNVNR